MADVPNVEIVTLPVAGRIERVQIADEEAVFHYTGGPVTFRHHHEQECCEQVYADWTAVGDHLRELLRIYGWNGLTVKGVPGMGILLAFGDIAHPLKIFVPCYNVQNGYYSSDLSLIIEVAGTRAEYNVGAYVKDEAALSSRWALATGCR